MTEFKLPDLGENVEGGDVLSVLVEKGQEVSQDQAILELETDKAVLEVPATFAGTIEKILVKAGDHVSVGQAILNFKAAQNGDSGASVSEMEAARPAQPQEKPKPQKSAVQKEAPKPEPAARRSKTEASPARREDRAGKVVEFSRPAPEAESARLVAAAPSVRRLAREIGVDIHRVEGSGPRGRISKEDVKAHAQQRLSGGPMPVPPASALPDFSRWGEVRRERMSAVRRATAQHMSRSWSQIPHVTQADECDITELEERRQAYSERVEREGGKLTVTGIILKVLAAAVGKFPQFGASIDPASEEIIYKEYVNVGVAVDTPRGLLVPVIRDVDQKNILQISQELKELAGKARDGKLDLESMQGGCITVTNLGGIGGISFTPIVNWPEVAILGVSRGSVRPVFRDGDLEPRLILPLSLSYDHRLIDGADAARFLRWICQALEDPFLLALEG